jgi:hypothetical protein
MKTIFVFALSVILLNGFIACKTSKIFSETGKDSKHALNIQRISGYMKPENNRDVAIEDWLIEGDVAKLAISYSGGCATHSFKAVFDGKYMKSLPAKAEIFIEHTHGNDNCRMLIIDTLYINLSGARYDANAGSVIIGFNGSDKVLEYSYKAK